MGKACRAGQAILGVAHPFLSVCINPFVRAVPLAVIAMDVVVAQGKDTIRLGFGAGGGVAIRAFDADDFAGFRSADEGEERGERAGLHDSVLEFGECFRFVAGHSCGIGGGKAVGE